MSLRDFVIAEANRQGLDPSLALRVMMAESGGRTNAVSPKGARGPMQLMPGTAKDMGVKNINDPYENIVGGIKYLKQQKDTFGDDRLALAAYNAGPAAVKRYGGVPPYQETQKYTEKIMANQQGFSGSSIFGQPAPGQGRQASGFSGQDIFGAAKPLAASAQAPAELVAVPVKSAKKDLLPLDKQSFDLLNSPIGGAIRGLRDYIDAGAQLLARGVEGIAPAGSEFEKWARGQREMVEQVNREAERVYQQDWRKGQMEGIDVGRLGGNIAGGLALGPALGLNPATLGGGAALGAASGALTPVYEPQDDFLGQKLAQAGLGAAGGAAGSVVGNIGARILNPFPREITESGKLAREAAQRLNVQLSPGQETGNVILQGAERVLSRIPGSSGAIRKIQEANEQAINKAAAKEIGAAATNLSETVMAETQQRLGTQFGNLAAKSDITFGQDFINNLAKIEAKNRSLGSFASPEIDNLITKSLDLASRGRLQGEAYQNIRSELTSNATKAYKAGDSELGRALKSVRNSLDDAAKQGLSQADQVAWDTLRRQYANFKMLSAPRVIEAGNIRPATLTSELRRQSPQQFVTGAHPSPLLDIARLSEGFKSSVVPSSNTAELSMLQSLMFGNPVTSALTGGAANLMQNAMFSPLGRAYLTRGLLPLPFGVEQALRGATAMGGAGLLTPSQ